MAEPPAGQIAASGQSSTPTIPARPSVEVSAQSDPLATFTQCSVPESSTASLSKADCVVDVAPPLPGPVTDRKKRFKLSCFTLRRRKAQLEQGQPNQEQEQEQGEAAETTESQDPVLSTSCDACGRVDSHITRLCPQPKECGLCFLPGHDAESCELGFLASFGRGMTKVEPGVNDHPDARRRAMQAVVAAMKRMEKRVQDAYEEREKNLEVGLTDADRAKLASFRRPMRDFWEMIQAYQDLHLGADDAYSTFLVSLEQQKAEQECVEGQRADQTEAVETQADRETLT
ncbi:hypothetical protein BKA63DRAFT_607824 [Paraphoma chrysanthemicola]|nr:hypothetical protein BKA63DRAFT_607824 [Paraphoma chrysanthemicola]